MCLEMMIIVTAMLHLQTHGMPRPAHRETLLRLARDRPVFRAREAYALGVPWAYLGRLVREGSLLRVARGLYAHPDHSPGEHASLAEVALRAPRATICLLSALRFHGLTTQNPFDVWILIPSKQRAPSFEGPSLRVVRASGRALEAGVETHRLEGVDVRITSVAKSVCDAFRYRTKVGLDVALEALREGLRRKLATVDELHEMAVADRVANVMRPYLEALT